MAHYNIDASPGGPRTSEVLQVLARAMGEKTLLAAQRMPTASDAHSPEEGLALLGAYVAIEDRHVRQAILDAVMAVAAARR